jgi:hypothetical protein
MILKWLGTNIYFFCKCLSKCEKQIDNCYTFYFWNLERIAKKVSLWIKFVGFKAQALVGHQTTSRLQKNILSYLSYTTKFA